MNQPSIYSYVQEEENSFQTEEIRVGDNWNWNFRNHVQLIFHLKNGVFFTGENDWMRAFKNIMQPMLNLSYWAEDIEVKDIVFYIENKMGRVLSFLVKKYHEEVYVKENDLDTLIDEITESDLDYGGVLVQKTSGARPEVLQLQTIAFCDQTDILGGTLAFKHSFSPDKLRTMSKLGWGEERNGATISIEDLIEQAEPQKDPVGMQNTKKNRTTSKNIEVYIVRGNMPDHYLNDNDDMEYHCNQLQIIGFYYDKEGKKQGVTLYRKKENEGNLKFFTSRKVVGRALGAGDGEALLHPQVWTNFLTIHKHKLMEAGSKVPLFTDDDTFQNRNQIRDMENLEVVNVAEGKSIQQVPTASPLNVNMLKGGIDEWFAHGQLTASAFDPMLGKEPASGTTFRGQERTVAQGRGLHDRRRGQRAKFIEEIYRDWIIPDMVRSIVGGKKFIASLNSEEMGWVSQQLADNYVARQQTEDVLNGEIPRDKEFLKQEFLENFSKSGNKHIIEILKEEFRDVEMRIGINVASKQKDLAMMSDKILSIFQSVSANPQGFQQVIRIPGMANAFNDILEYSGISQVDFATFINTPLPSPEMEAQPQTGAMPQMLPNPQPQA